ncbi:MAG: aa3-type cytochrome oxidase subunit CtaJ [Pseudonocardiaceae bacterium]
MSAVETVLVLALSPLAILGVIAILTLWPKFARAPRYRPGQEWTYPPVWWTANPDSLPASHGTGAGGDRVAGSRRGGARGSW